MNTMEEMAMEVEKRLNPAAKRSLDHEKTIGSDHETAIGPDHEITQELRANLSDNYCGEEEEKDHKIRSLLDHLLGGDSDITGKQILTAVNDTRAEKAMQLWMFGHPDQNRVVDEDVIDLVKHTRVTDEDVIDLAEHTKTKPLYKQTWQSPLISTKTSATRPINQENVWGTYKTGKKAA